MYYDNENFYPGRARDSRTEKLVRPDQEIRSGPRIPDTDFGMNEIFVYSRGTQNQRENYFSQNGLL